MTISMGRTVAALAQLPGKVVRAIRAPEQVVSYVIDQRWKGIPGELVSYDSQAEEEEPSLLRVGKLVQMLDAMQDSACSAPGRRLDLDGPFGPLEIVARS